MKVCRTYCRNFFASLKQYLHTPTTANNQSSKKPMSLPKICVSEELLADPNYSRKTVKLDDERILSYSECGNLKSEHIVLFHIGLMGSSLATIVIHEHALKENIRLISLDYPGIGESTLVPDRSVQDWAKDVEAFCQKVLPEDAPINLLGHCLGGPHVLAVWARMMHRVTNVTLAAPWVGEIETNPWWMKNFVQRLPMQDYVPSVGAPILTVPTYLNYPLSYLVGPELKKLLRTVSEIQSYNRFQGLAGNREMIRLALISSCKESFWDPILEEIAAKYQKDGKGNMPVHIYHGTNDAMVSREACELLVGWLGGANCHVMLTSIDNADHNSILLDPKNMSAILEPPKEEAC